jgi:hypothetical protein
LLRAPDPGETPNTLKIRYLPPEIACRYALASAQWHRIDEFLRELHGPFGPRLSEKPAREALRLGVEEVRRAFAANPRLRILNDNLEEDLEVIDDLLALAAQNEKTGRLEIDRPFDERFQYLMGRRRPDGSIAGAGALMAQECVEILLEPRGWNAPAPGILDTPWIPAVHNSRRVDLITRAAETADAILLVDLARPLTVEDWLADFLKKRPEMASRVIVVMNQVDAVDVEEIKGRDGFLAAVGAARKTMLEHGMNPGNVVFTVSWLPYLKTLPPGPDVAERIRRLEGVLERLSHKAAKSGAEAAVIEAVRAACLSGDGGMDALRRKIMAVLSARPRARV